MKRLHHTTRRQERAAVVRRSFARETQAVVRELALHGGRLGVVGYGTTCGIVRKGKVAQYVDLEIFDTLWRAGYLTVNGRLRLAVKRGLMEVEEQHWRRRVKARSGE